MCLFKSPAWVHAKSHPGTVQTKGFSPVWIRMCFFRSLFCTAAKSHPAKTQTNGRSPVCTRMCRVKPHWLTYARSHPCHVHLNLFSPIRYTLCQRTAQRAAEKLNAEPSGADSNRLAERRCSRKKGCRGNKAAKLAGGYSKAFGSRVFFQTTAW